MDLKFYPCEVFRKTSNVIFFDASISGSNGSDVVIHDGHAISPSGEDSEEKYYVHKFQVDHNLVIQGTRTFTLLNPDWDEPHHVIFLHRKMGALQIPTHTYHRSISGHSGSIVLNQALRSQGFDVTREFNPVKLVHENSLITAKETSPVIWSWSKGRIRKSYTKGSRIVDMEEYLVRLTA